MPKKISSEVVYDIEVEVVGLQHRITTSTRRFLQKRLTEGNGPIFCDAIREPENLHDENAVKVVVKEGTYKDLHIGYLPRVVSAVLANYMDEGKVEDVLVSVVGIDVDRGTADAHLQFVSTRKVKIQGKPKQRKRKTA